MASLASSGDKPLWERNQRYIVYIMHTRDFVHRFDIDLGAVSISKMLSCQCRNFCKDKTVSSPSCLYNSYFCLFLDHFAFINISGYQCETVQYGKEWFNTLRPRQNGCHFADDTFKSIFMNENATLLIEISLKFFPKGPINNIPATNHHWFR